MRIAPPAVNRRSVAASRRPRLVPPVHAHWSTYLEVFEGGTVAWHGDRSAEREPI